MKVSVFCVFLMFAFVVVVHGRPDKYTTKFDNVDVDAILNNKRLLKNYVACLQEKGPCTPDGLELKNNLSDALKTDCSKCSERQQETSKRVVNHLFEKEKEIFGQLEKQYDPTGEYRKKYESQIKTE